MSKMIDSETIQIEQGDTVVVYRYQGSMYVTVGQVCSGDEDECTHCTDDKHVGFKNEYSALPLDDSDDDEYTISHVETNTVPEV